MNLGPIYTGVRIIGVISLAILLSINYLDFLINQESHSKNRLQPQMIRYDASIDVDTPKSIIDA